MDAHESKKLRKGEGLHTQRKPKKKMTLQRELTQFDDELRKYCERVEAELFDRRSRLSMSEKQECNPASDSIFGEIFKS